MLVIHCFESNPIIYPSMVSQSTQKRGDPCNYWTQKHSETVQLNWLAQQNSGKKLHGTSWALDSHQKIRKVGKMEKTPWKTPWKVSEKCHFRAAPGDTRRRDPVARASARSGRCRSLRVWGQRSPEFSTRTGENWGEMGGKPWNKWGKNMGFKGIWMESLWDVNRIYKII